MKVAILFSSGKDSCYAMYIAKKKHEIKCLISIESENPDSWMFHTPNIHLVEKQAECLGIPLIKVKTAGEKEKELDDLKGAIVRAKEEYNIDGVVTGALYSKYQWTRVDKICGDLELVSIAPLWHIDPEEYMREIIKNNFKIILTKMAAYGLDKSWLGRVLNSKDVEKLVELNKRIQLSICGEGGEYESLVLDCPLFKKRMIIKDSEIQMEKEHTGRLIIKEVELIDK